MTISLTTPSSSGTEFFFAINRGAGEIVITSSRGNEFRYNLAAIKDLYNWLKYDLNGGWVLLGTKNENETPSIGTVEEWARSSNNPIGEFYGLSNGNRGRFASFIPPILEYLGLAEVEHNPVNNRMRAL